MASKELVDLSRLTAEPPMNVVFCPNLVHSPTFGSVYRGFMTAGKGMRSWTCKADAKPGDLYLFYFGAPVLKIAGLAVCRKQPDPDGWKRRGWRQKMYFCPWDEVHHFRKPVGVDVLRADPKFANWWGSKPYRGRPKAIPQATADSLLRLIAMREPNLRHLLDLYIRNTKTSSGSAKRGQSTQALEGTIFERISKQRVRSQVLRDEKVARSMDANGHLVCEVPGCGFDFLETYGEIGRNFAHVHHRRPVAERERVHSAKDLAIVCANCHAMIHRGGKCRQLDGLIRLKR